MKSIVAALLLGVTSALAQSASPSVPAYRARILGVFDARTGDPIEGVEVTHVASGMSALTTKTGTVTLLFLPDGGGYLRIRKLGFAPLTQFVTISVRDTVPVTVILKANEIVLPAVVTRDSTPRHISPGLNDFEERRKYGMGQYITETELRKNDNREMPDLLRRFSGMKISCKTRTPRACTASSLTAPCRGTGMMIYVNGTRINDNNLLMLNIGEFAAIEAYPHSSTVPSQYNMTGADCGVLLFWSREK